ncbi:MAG: hypothetical protein M0Q91_11925 [Methanoregula sp.]|jgi:hypothetical protein|nr:hypothetical protein [Methanoregula sp.]
MEEIKIHQFNPVIYPYKIWIVVSKSADIIAERFYEYNGKPIEFLNRDTGNLRAFVMTVTSKDQAYYGAIMLFRSKKSMSYELVAHESSHAAKYLFEHIGADVKEHEPFEFVVGWIADCCYQVKTGKFK